MGYIKHLIFMSIFPAFVLSVVEEICEQKGEYITCPFGKVLDIKNVDYGRSRVGICNPYNVPNLPTNCHSTKVSTNTVIKICQYRGSCFLEADNTILGEDPCPNFPKYLTVDYDCMVPTTTTVTMPKTTATTTPSTTSTTTRQTTTSASTTSTTTTTIPQTTLTTIRTTRTIAPPTTTPTILFSPFNAPKGSQVCHDYLVSGKHPVPDGKLSASSVYQTGNVLDNHGAERGRLFSDAVIYANGTYDRGGWASAVDNQQQYIQVQLNTPSIVRGVATQGRHVNSQDL